MKILNFSDSVRSQRTKNLLEEIQTEIFFVSELPKEISRETSRFLINFTETRIRKVNYLRQIRISKFLPVSRFESFESAFQAILKSTRQFILIISPGQWFESEFFSSLIPLLKNWKPGTLLAGHILDHAQRGQYYDLHTISMVIAVKEFKEIFSPGSLENCWCSSANQKSVFTCFLRSRENHHDDYTPWWIEPIPQGASPFFTRRFSRFLEHALKNGKRIESFSSKMRALKTYCYPQFTQSAIHHVIRNNSEGLSLENCYQKAKTLQILSHYLRDKNLKKEEIYWANNEPLFCDDFKLSFDRFVGLASGLKLFTQFALFPKSSSAQILVLDENAEQLNWFKKILSFESLPDCIEWAQQLKDDKQKEVSGFGKQKIIFLGKTPLNQPDTISLLDLQSEWESPFEAKV